jgi:hypothetical protein
MKWVGSLFVGEQKDNITPGHDASFLFRCHTQIDKCKQHHSLVTFVKFGAVFFPALEIILHF